MEEANRGHNCYITRIWMPSRAILRNSDRRLALKNASWIVPDAEVSDEGSLIGPLVSVHRAVNTTQLFDQRRNILDRS